MSSSHPLVEGVVEACHSGNVGTLQALLTQYPELDINLTTEGGVTLLMHTIIGAGEWFYTHLRTWLPPQRTCSNGLLFPSCCRYRGQT